jgi:acyl carrier protein
MTAEDRTAIESKVIAVVNQTVADWDIDIPGGITGKTRLIKDLNFESIDVVQFAIGVEQMFGRKGLPFEKLFLKDGAYVDDVSVAEVTDFLCAELGAVAGAGVRPPPPPAGGPGPCTRSSLALRSLRLRLLARPPRRRTTFQCGRARRTLARLAAAQLLDLLGELAHALLEPDQALGVAARPRLLALRRGGGLLSHLHQPPHQHHSPAAPPLRRIDPGRPRRLRLAVACGSGGTVGKGAQQPSAAGGTGAERPRRGCGGRAVGGGCECRAAPLQALAQHGAAREIARRVH